MEQIGYEEAARLIERHPVQVRKAVSHGVLTQVPTTGYRKSLVKEQVLLFKGKQLRLSSLSRDERKQWDIYRDMAEGKIDHATGDMWQSLFNPEIRKELAKDMIRAALEGVQELSPLASGKS